MHRMINTIKKSLCGVLTLLLIVIAPVATYADSSAPPEPPIDNISATAPLTSTNNPSTSSSQAPQPPTPLTPLTNSVTPPVTVNATPSTTTGADIPMQNTDNTTIQNQTNSTAQTGSAQVSSNTAAGNAMSGNAQTIANVINAVQSSADFGAGGLTVFTRTITGDIRNDILIDPGALSVTGVKPDKLDGVQTNNSNTRIDNAITLKASSGDARVDHNTSAGNATSGTATAVANVVNLVNSIIGARQSFLGVINILGNLHGDILVPAGLVDSLLNNNAPTSKGEGNSNPNYAASTIIANDILTSANSGTASVDHNVAAGNATSGTSGSNVSIYNLTGQQIVATNTLLVFVNVSGKWIGLIMNAPAGATGAELGGGISSLSNIQPDSPQYIQSTKIHNTIAANAATGDARVDHNNTAGDATSGNAASAVNLVNINNSSLSASNWFGLLFINVLGNWFGNFGVAPTEPGGKGSIAPPTQTPDASSGRLAPKIFRIVTSGRTTNLGSQYHGSTTGGISNPEFHVLSAAAIKPPIIGANEHTNMSLASLASIALAILTVLLLIGYVLFTRRQFRYSAAQH